MIAFPHFFVAPDSCKRTKSRWSNGLYIKGWLSSTSSSGTCKIPVCQEKNAREYLVLFSFMMTWCSQERTLSLLHAYNKEIKKRKSKRVIEAYNWGWNWSLLFLYKTNYTASVTNKTVSFHKSAPFEWRHLKERIWILLQG